MPPSSSSMGASIEVQELPAVEPECFTCRLIGSGTLAAVGIYGLNQSRAHAPGSRIGKNIMGALGVGFLVGSVVRWNANKY